MPEKPINVLLVEDDDVDVRVVLRAFEQLGIDTPVAVAHDGIEGLAMLRGEDGYDRLQGPTLVLLDLNMPRMNGHEFLTELRRDPNLSRTIVFVLTTSSDDRDRAAAYDHHVAGYLLKTEMGEGLMKQFRLFKSFLESVHFPSAPAANH